MPLLDVSEILFDPDFMDANIPVIRSVRTMVNGRTVDTPGQYVMTANIQPSSAADLRRLPEAERIGSFITVVTQFKLQPLTSTNGPDIVVWQGNNFRVKSVNDWSQYGNGFVNAVCELTDMVMTGP